MKHKYFFLGLLLIIFSCSSNNDETIDVSSQLLEDEPNNPSGPAAAVGKLPKEINYKFSNNFDNEIYKSDNHYTYDNLNRVTEISIKSFMNEEPLADYDYKIIYDGTTSFAKGFSISEHNYQQNSQNTKYVKLKYTIHPEINIDDYAYYSYVNNEGEINNNEFVENDGFKIEGSFSPNINFFMPKNCGPNLFEGIKMSYCHQYGKSIQEMGYISDDNANIRMRRFLPDMANLNVSSSAFTDVKFDPIFWFFFLKEQIFHYETGYGCKDVQLQEGVGVGDDWYFRTIEFKNDIQVTTYIDNTYPTYKMYRGKYWEQEYETPINDEENTYEYSVTYY